MVARIPTWPEAMDPADSRSYRMDFGVRAAGAAAAALDDGQTLANPTVAVDAAAAALGVSVPVAGLTADGAGMADRAIGIWPEVAPEFQADPAFEAGISVTVTVTADIVPTGRIQRSAQLIVRQR